VVHSILEDSHWVLFAIICWTVRNKPERSPQGCKANGPANKKIQPVVEKKIQPVVEATSAKLQAASNA